MTSLLVTAPKFDARCIRCALRQQIRHATLLRRPKRPYTFTQLITLSDGSTFTHRTTSPQPVYKTVRDTKNSIMWNPSSQKLLQVEEDEAGRLRKFRERFGRGFDAEAVGVGEGDEDGMGGEGRDQGANASASQSEDSLLDLIAGYGQAPEKTKDTGAGGPREEAKKSGKRKGGEK